MYNIYYNCNMKLAMEHSNTGRLSNRQQHLISCQEMGKKTKPLYEQYLDKPNSVLSHKDIDGSMPVSTLSRKTAHYNQRYSNERNQSLDPQQTNYQAHPYEHNQPDVFKFKTTRKSGNPLEPAYPMPSFSKSTAQEGKFIRDAMQCRDIEGAYPSKKESKLNINTLTNRIDFPQKAPLKKVSDQSSLQVGDINQDQVYSHRSTRLCNPLVPSYNIYQDSHQISDQKAHIKIRDPILREHTQYNVKDIIGDNVQHKYNKKVTQPTQVNKDIEGAQAGTKRRMIVTERHVNPLAPKYTQLDGSPVDLI